MRRHLGWLSGVLVLALAGGAWAQGIGGDIGGKPQEDPVKAAIEKFQKDYAEGQKKKDEQLRAAALDIFNGLCNEQKVVDVVGKVLKTKTETPIVKNKCVELLRQSQNVKVLSTLEQAFSANEKDECGPNVVRAIGAIQAKEAVKSLEKIIKPRINQFDKPEACQIARAGIEALGQLRFTESIDTLVRLFEPVNSGKPAPDAQIPEGDQAKENERNQTFGSLIASLTGLTAEGHQSYEDWKNWWSKNKKTFKFQ